MFSSLSNAMWPPIIRTRRSLMASPSPVPPYFREVSSLACSKERKIRCLFSLLTPIPSSLTEKVVFTIPSPAGFCTAFSLICPPRGVNFTAFPRRLISTWFRCRLSPVTHSSEITNSRVNSIFFSMVCGSIRLYTPSSSCFMLKIPFSSFIFPLSILDISKMSLIRLSRYWEELSILCRQSSTFCESCFSCMAIPVMPIIAFMGVRIS